MDAHNLDYSQIDDQVFIGTNACCQMHFAEQLLAKGITADVSLEEKHLDMPFGVSAFLWLPTVDHTPPMAAQIDAGVSFLRSVLASGAKVYIHCKNGHGRGPSLYAAYLIREKGLSVEEAVGKIKEKRPSAHLWDEQIALLKSL